MRFEHVKRYIDDEFLCETTYATYQHMMPHSATDGIERHFRGFFCVRSSEQKFKIQLIQMITLKWYYVPYSQCNWNLSVEIRILFVGRQLFVARVARSWQKLDSITPFGCSIKKRLKDRWYKDSERAEEREGESVCVFVVVVVCTLHTMSRSNWQRTTTIRRFIAITSRRLEWPIWICILDRWIVGRWQRQR